MICSSMTRDQYTCKPRTVLKNAPPTQRQRKPLPCGARSKGWIGRCVPLQPPVYHTPHLCVTLCLPTSSAAACRSSVRFCGRLLFWRGLAETMAWP